jgi:RNA polymerase sigma-70 factor (ECF subfamily)
MQPALPSMIVHHPGVQSNRRSQQRAIFEENRHRIYSFAFWMTGSEPMAEHVSERTFLRAFSLCNRPDAEVLDRALLRELSGEAGIVIERPRLRCKPVREVESLSRNRRRDDLEQAILALPHTERLIFCMHDGDGYEHARIARTLGITEEDSRHGLHQARLRIRELVAEAARPIAA